MNAEKAVTNSHNIFTRLLPKKTSHKPSYIQVIISKIANNPT